MDAVDVPSLQLPPILIPVLIDPEPVS